VAPFSHYLDCACVTSTDFRSASPGSWDPNQVTWVEHVFEFTCPSWGIKANMEQLPSGVRFTHPLQITAVNPGSEAEYRGIRERDVVVGIRTPLDLDFREVKAEVEKAGVVDKKELKSYVDNSIRDILMQGGQCTLKVKRRRGTLTCERCNSDEIIEVREDGDLICNLNPKPTTQNPNPKP
jgi:hypothetical protein